MSDKGIPPKFSHLKKRPWKLKAGIAVSLGAISTNGPPFSTTTFVLLLPSSSYLSSSIFLLSFLSLLLSLLLLVFLFLVFVVIAGQNCFLTFFSPNFLIHLENCDLCSIGFCVFHIKIDESENLGMWACMIFGKNGRIDRKSTPHCKWKDPLLWYSCVGSKKYLYSCPCGVAFK